MVKKGSIEVVHSGTAENAFEYFRELDQYDEENDCFKIGNECVDTMSDNPDAMIERDLENKYPKDFIVVNFEGSEEEDLYSYTVLSCSCDEK